MTRQYANRLIAAGKVYHELETIVSNQERNSCIILPRNELQLSTLKRVAPDPEKRLQIYVDALESVEGEASRVTAKIIEEKSKAYAVVPEKSPMTMPASERLSKARKVFRRLKANLESLGCDESLVMELERLLGER